MKQKLTELPEETLKEFFELSERYKEITEVDEAQN